VVLRRENLAPFAVRDPIDETAPPRILDRIVNLAIDIRVRDRLLDRGNIKFEAGERLRAGDHPGERDIRKTAVGIAAAHIAVDAGKPALLDMSPRQTPNGGRPEGRCERAALFIDGDGMQAVIDIVAKHRVLEPEKSARN